MPVNEETIITFPGGLVGCPSWQHFRLMKETDDGVIGLLQSLDETNVSFLVTDPDNVCSDYECELGDEDCELLQVSDTNDLRLLCTISIRNGDPMQVSANLLGPLVVNLKTGLAKQLVLEDSGYSCQHPIDPPDESHGPIAERKAN